MTATPACPVRLEGLGCTHSGWFKAGRPAPRKHRDDPSLQPQRIIGTQG